MGDSTWKRKKIQRTGPPLMSPYWICRCSRSVKCWTSTGTVLTQYKGPVCYLVCQWQWIIASVTQTTTIQIQCLPHYHTLSLPKTMMTSSNENLFRVTGHLCGEFTGPRWFPHTKASDAELWCLLCVWINGFVNSREAGDLRCYCAHCGVTVMLCETLLLA